VGTRHIRHNCSIANKLRDRANRARRQVAAKFRVRSANPTGPAHSAAEYGRLTEFYRQAEEYGTGGISQLENGRFRFYGELDPADVPGKMVGRVKVREWDPATGNQRTWFETSDSQGTVRIVRPETGGPKVHYIFDAQGNYVGTR